MRIFKRGLSLFLTFILLFSMVPVVTQAAEEQKEPQLQVSNNEMTVEATDSFGSMHGKEITQYQEDTESSNGYNVIDLTVQGNYATTEFCVLEPAILMAILPGRKK